MRFARPSSLLLILFAALLAGCGGNQIAAEEVPVDPPVLTIPSDPDSAPGATTADADDTDEDEEDADADATATADPAASSGGTTSSGTPGGTTSSGGATSPGTTGGAAATATPTPAPTEDAGGASADEGLDQFCADNPGAC